jgi:hypothetical protein
MLRLYACVTLVQARPAIGGAGGSQDGYLVQFEGQGAQWIPADEFARRYRPIDVPELELIQAGRNAHGVPDPDCDHDWIWNRDFRLWYCRKCKQDQDEDPGHCDHIMVYNPPGDADVCTECGYDELTIPQRPVDCEHDFAGSGEYDLETGEIVRTCSKCRLKVAV